jgi:hypothetical protein
MTKFSLSTNFSGEAYCTSLTALLQCSEHRICFRSLLACFVHGPFRVPPCYRCKKRAVGLTPTLFIFFGYSKRPRQRPTRFFVDCSHNYAANSKSIREDFNTPICLGYWNFLVNVAMLFRTGIIRVVSMHP